MGLPTGDAQLNGFFPPLAPTDRAERHSTCAHATT
jgi:hypothetical protein